MSESFVAARIGKPHGLRGEVTVQVHTDDPQGRFVPGATFATEPPDRGPLSLRGVRVHQGIYLLGFEDHLDRTAAEALRGTRLHGWFARRCRYWFRGHQLLSSTGRSNQPRCGQLKPGPG